jgi:hypothetical protein
MSLRRSLASLSLGAGLALACVSLTGCGSALAPTTTTSAAISVTGNWQLASAAASATKLAAISGELTGTSSSITGILHADASNACIAANAPFEVSGSANKANLVTLTGPIANGKITITGTLAADGQSLTRPTYTVTGGSCAFTAPAAATAHVYSSISGNYAGSFSDPNGQVISITAALTQTPTSDTDGNFQLSGTGTMPNNPCFPTIVSVSNSQVTGGSFNLTYTDATTQNSVSTLGTFSADGSTLTVTQWTLSGPCGSDTGTGLLIKQVAQ